MENFDKLKFKLQIGYKSWRGNGNDEQIDGHDK